MEEIGMKREEIWRKEEIERKKKKLEKIKEEISEIDRASIQNGPGMHSQNTNFQWYL